MNRNGRLFKKMELKRAEINLKNGNLRTRTLMKCMSIDVTPPIHATMLKN